MWRLQPEDRRDLAQLALTVLVFGLVVVPWLHLGVTHGGEALSHAARALAHHASGTAGVPVGPDDRGPVEDRESGSHSHALGGTEHLQVLADLPLPTRLELPTWKVEALVRVAYADATVDLLRLQPQLPQGP